MRHLTLILTILLLTALSASAQTGPTAYRMRSGAGAPTSTCVAGPPVTDVYLRTDTTPRQQYVCKAAPNTWELVSGAAAGGDVVGPSTSTDSELPLFSGTGGKTLKRSNTLNGYVKLSSGVVAAAPIPEADLPSAINAAKIADGSVSSSEFQFLANVTSDLQTQLNARALAARLINTTSPITGGGDLSADRTFACATCATTNTAQTFTAKKTFTPDATNAMLNIGVAASAPSTPVAGDKYLNSGDNKEYTYSNGNWRENFLAGISLVNLAVHLTSDRLPAANNTLAVLDDSAAYCADAGGSDTYACSLSPAPAAYVTGARYRFKANTANTGAATINLNSLGAKTIKKAEGGVTTDLADNDIRSGQVVELAYDGTNMQMQSTLGNAGGGGSTSYALSFRNQNAGNPADGTTYFVGFPISGYGLLAADGDAKIEIPSGCTVKAVTWRVFLADGVNGSNEAVSVYFRKNNTTDTTLSTTSTWDGLATKFERTTGLSISMATGDFFTIKIVTPTWATNPTNVQFSGNVFCQ